MKCLLRGVRLFPGRGVRLSPSLAGWWCLALWMFVFTCLPIHLPPSLASGVRIFGCGGAT